MKGLHAGVLSVIAAAIKPQPRLHIWEWLREINYKVKGQLYNIAAAPYLEEPFRAAKDSTVRRIVMPCPVQSGKSTFLQGIILYFLKVERANICYYSQDESGLGEFSETRMIPDYERYCKDLHHPDRNKTKKHLVITRAGNWVAMLAGNNKNNRNSRSARISINDEAALLEAGALAECGKRTSAYQKTNGLHIEIGTPENSGVIDRGEFKSSDYYADWMNSTRHIWHVKCPKCSGVAPLSYKFYKFDTDEVTKPGGRLSDDGKSYEGGEWDFSELRKSIRWQCECGHELDTESARYRKMLKTGHYQQTNHKAESKNRGYHYPGFAVRWNDPKDLVISFISANEIAKRGLHDKLNQVITKDFGEFWHPRQSTLQERKTKVTGGYHLGDSDWSEELVVDGIRRRNLTVDVQKDHFYMVIRMWGLNGISRLLYTAKVNHWQDIKDTQRKFDVYEGTKQGRLWIPGRVFVDSAWGRYQKYKGDSEVHRKCAQHNWWALRGQDTNKFNVTVKARGRSVQIERYYSDIKAVTVGGSACKTFSFANPVICGHLDELKAQNGPRWEVPDDVPRWYLEMIDNKQPVPRDDGKGLIWEEIGPAHPYDCFADDVMVLTDQGFKLFAELTGKELLATSNMATQRLEFQAPTAIIEKDYHGEMVHIKNTRLDLLVTPTHRMVVKRRGAGKYSGPWEICTAADLKYTHKLQSFVMPRGHGKTGDIDICGRAVNRLVFCRMAGWFVSEGWIPRNDFTTIRVSQNRWTEKCKAMRKDFAAAGFPLKYGGDKNGAGWYCCVSRDVSDWFRRQFYPSGVDGRACAYLRAPRSVMDSGRRGIEEFLETARMGDGWTTKGGREPIATISHGLALDYAEANVRLGRRAKIQFRGKDSISVTNLRGRQIQAMHDQYYVAADRPHPYSLRDAHNNSSIKRKHYSGKVYCATVPNKTLVVMDSGGRVIVTGNCEKMQLPQAYNDKLFAVNVDDESS